MAYIPSSNTTAYREYPAVTANKTVFPLLRTPVAASLNFIINDAEYSINNGLTLVGSVVTWGSAFQLAPTDSVVINYLA